MKAIQVKINDHVIEDLFFTDISTDDSKIRLLILQKRKGQLENIAQTNVFPSKLENFSKKEMIKIAIRDCFKMAQCSVCHDKFSAISLSQSEIGNLCVYCWNYMIPAIPWIQLDNLENYANKKH